jgi:hypothetical protein
MTARMIILPGNMDAQVDQTPRYLAFSKVSSTARAAPALLGAVADSIGAPEVPW